MATSKKKPAGRKTGIKARQVVVLVATRKGAWMFSGDAARKKWKINGPHFLGHTIHHMLLDPRDGKTLLAAAEKPATLVQPCSAQLILANPGRKPKSRRLLQKRLKAKKAAA